MIKQIDICYSHAPLLVSLNSKYNAKSMYIIKSSGSCEKGAGLTKSETLRQVGPTPYVGSNWNFALQLLSLLCIICYMRMI